MIPLPSQERRGPLAMLFLLLLIVGVGIYLARDFGYLGGEGAATTTPQTLQELIDSGQATVEFEEVPSAPSLERAVSFSADFPAEARPILSAKIAALKEKLIADARDVTAWLDLGIQYRIAGDSEGARGAWEYAGVLAPSDSTIFANLGELYGFTLKDYEKAEYNFAKALVNNPQNLVAWRNLFDLYRYAYKMDTDAAERTIDEAISKNPGNVDFLVLKAEYLRDLGRKEDAKRAYDEAIAGAKRLGNTQLVELLTTEKNAL